MDEWIRQKELSGLISAERHGRPARSCALKHVAEGADRERSPARQSARFAFGYSEESVFERSGSRRAHKSRARPERPAWTQEHRSKSAPSKGKQRADSPPLGSPPDSPQSAPSSANDSAPPSPRQTSAREPTRGHSQRSRRSHRRHRHDNVWFDRASRLLNGTVVVPVLWVCRLVTNTFKALFGIGRAVGATFALIDRATRRAFRADRGHGRHHRSRRAPDLSDDSDSASRSSSSRSARSQRTRSSSASSASASQTGGRTPSLGSEHSEGSLLALETGSEEIEADSLAGPSVAITEEIVTVGIVLDSDGCNAVADASVAPPSPRRAERLPSPIWGLSPAVQSPMLLTDTSAAAHVVVLPDATSTSPRGDEVPEPRGRLVTLPTGRRMGFPLPYVRQVSVTPPSPDVSSGCGSSTSSSPGTDSLWAATSQHERHFSALLHRRPHPEAASTTTLPVATGPSTRRTHSLPVGPLEEVPPLTLGSPLLPVRNVLHHRSDED